MKSSISPPLIALFAIGPAVCQSPSQLAAMAIDLATGQDVTAGAQWSGQGAAGGRFEMVGDAAVATLSVSCRATYANPGSVSGNISIQYAHPTPVDVDVELLITGWSASPTCAAAAARVELVGHGVLDASQGTTLTFSRLTLDAAGLSIRLAASCGASAGPFCGTSNTNASAACQVRIRRSRCLQEYGPVPCGLAWASYEEPWSAVGRHRVQIYNPIWRAQDLPFVVLLVGTQRISVPFPLPQFWSCPLLTDAIVGIPLAAPSMGVATFEYPIPIGTFTLQVAMFGFGTGPNPTIGLTPGLALNCP